VDHGPAWGLYLPVLLLLAAVAIALGVQHKRFAFVAYGAVYGYAGITNAVLPFLTDATLFLGYFMITGSLMIVSLAVLARRTGRTE
jgi:hypothetical protein